MTMELSGSNSAPTTVEPSIRHGTSGMLFHIRPDHPGTESDTSAQTRVKFQTLERCPASQRSNAVTTSCSPIPTLTMVRGRVQYTRVTAFTTQPVTGLSDAQTCARESLITDATNCVRTEVGSQRAPTYSRTQPRHPIPSRSHDYRISYAHDTTRTFWAL